MIADRDYLLEMFRLAGTDIPIVMGSKNRVTGPTADTMIRTYNKGVFLNWLMSMHADRKQAEPVSVGTKIAAGVGTINMTPGLDIFAYVLRVLRGTNTSPGSVNITHNWTDIQGAANQFVFAITPADSGEVGSEVLYMATYAVGAKYTPGIHRTGFEYAVVGDHTASTTNAFSLAGPDDVRVEILPLTLYTLALSGVAAEYKKMMKALVS